VLVGLAGERFDEHGDLTDATRAEIRDVLVPLAARTRRLQRTGTEAAAG
jgi:hypothetical protein